MTITPEIATMHALAVEEAQKAYYRSMIFACCPCCESELCLEVPDETPAYRKGACPDCGAVLWHRLSRVDPQSWTEAEFLERHAVDEAANCITVIS